MPQKMPQSIVADQKAALGELREQGAQRQVRLLGDPGEQPISLARHAVVCGLSSSAPPGYP